MIGRSLPEYVFIRLCILGLRLIAPASIVYLLFSWYDGHFLVDDYLGYYAVAEAVFYLCIFLPRSRHLQEVSIVPPIRAWESGCGLAEDSSDIVAGFTEKDAFIYGWVQYQVIVVRAATSAARRHISAVCGLERRDMFTMLAVSDE